MKLCQQHCVSCHFLISYTRPGTEVIRIDVDDKCRQKATEDDFSWIPRNHRLKCHLHVWSEGSKKHDRFDTIVKTDRRNFCFYWDYHPGMLLPAAEKLQQRNAANKEASQDRRLTVIGLWVAGLALVANLIFNIADILIRWNTDVANALH